MVCVGSTDGSGVVWGGAGSIVLCVALLQLFIRGLLLLSTEKLKASGTLSKIKSIV